jgi:hypothetical protein
MKANYTEPVVCPKNRDMKKKWFVYFRWTDPVSGKRISIRTRADLNQIADKKERINSANVLANVIHNRLKNGWNPVTDSIEKEKEVYSLIEYLKQNMDTKRSSLKKKSIRSYDDILKMFIAWLERQKLTLLYPQNFSSVMARQYMNYLLTDRNYSGKSHNTQLGIIKSWFTDMQDLEIIDKNPFHGIKELPDEELIKLKTYLKENDPHFFAACCFVFFSFVLFVVVN